ncbi:MAG: endonuclease domain-containing protein [Defluviitaleaceae bacterium]|nr:endonuclease domain-containing protein [Defluviitaleaceae bacterium]
MAESREVGVVLLPRNKVLRLPSRELRNTVMRFTNKEIEENMPSVCETIKKATANVLNQ